MISLPFKKGEGKSAVDRVRELSSQGNSEKDIIRTLRNEGYSNEEISNALNRAIKFKVKGSNSQGYEGGPPMSEAPNRGRGNQSSQFVAPPPETGGSWKGGGDENVIEMSEEEEIGLEELIEEIVDEKWRSIEGEMDRMKKGFVKLQDQIDFLKQRVDEVENKQEEKKEELKGMIQDSSQKMEKIEGRIGSVEKAFKEFLPSLTENVRSLSEIVEKMKKRTKTRDKSSSKKKSKKSKKKKEE